MLTQCYKIAAWYRSKNLPLGRLEATYAVHLRLIGKLVVDFLLVIIELFSLGALVLSQCTRLTDGRTDRQTDRQLYDHQDRTGSGVKNNRMWALINFLAYSLNRQWGAQNVRKSFPNLNYLKLGARRGLISNCTSPSNLTRGSPSAAIWNSCWPLSTRPACTVQIMPACHRTHADETHSYNNQYNGITLDQHRNELVAFWT